MEGSSSRIPGRRDEGFVLITATWLLVLAGSITAILMLISLTVSTRFRNERDMLRTKLALESALETAIADRLFRGPASQWWLAPSEGSITIRGVKVKVELSSESSRLDVNDAGLKLIDTALRGFGVEARARGRMVGHLKSFRNQQHRIKSLAELRAWAAEANGGRTRCIENYLTISSGRPEPRQDQMAAELASALGHPGGTGAGPATPEAGAALRMEATSEGALPILAILRPTGIGEDPVAISSWSRGSRCSA